MAKYESGVIPQEIIDNIIAAVGNFNDKRWLKQCALVSSSFLLPSRKQLFSRITLSNNRDCQGIHQFLVQNPIIQHFVRTIILKGSRWGPSGEFSKHPEWMNGTSLLAILRLPICLECFTIRGFWDWDSFSSELKNALWNIIHSPSLKTLSLGGTTKLPITFFIHIDHLDTLDLYLLSPDDFVDAKGVVAPTSQTVIDRCVWHLTMEHVRCTRLASSAYFLLILDKKAPSNWEFLPFICGLRFFKINIELDSATAHDFDILSSLMGSLCMSLTSPATLEHLEFGIHFTDKYTHLTAHFDSYRFIENLRDADAWSHLDSIATHPAGSRLQRVDIIINYTFCYVDHGDEPDKDGIQKAVLDGLPSLLTKGIAVFVESLFKFEGK